MSGRVAVTVTRILLLSYSPISSDQLVELYCSRSFSSSPFIPEQQTVITIKMTKYGGELHVPNIISYSNCVK